MERDLRRRFNATWSHNLSHTVRADLERRLGVRIPFPIADTPVFFPPDLRDRFANAARGIIKELSDPRWIAQHEDAVPEAYRAPGRGPLPHVAQLDFAVVRERDGTLAPKLVELQGFPSLYGFQILLADVWATHLASLKEMPHQWRLFFGGHDRYRAMALMREVLVGDHDPNEVVLLDLDPRCQKTFPDFAITQRWWGIDPVCLTELKRDGRKLYRVKEGKTYPVRRIFQRIVFDELEQKRLQASFAFHEALDVEWVPHPAWWFIWSKRSMLYLKHPAVARTTRLSELKEIPRDLHRYVLKPLWSFAGAGVNVEPTPEDILRVPEPLRHDWVLQEKVEYTPALQSAAGDGVKVEVRMMFVRRDRDKKMSLLMNLIRLSRGKMMGVDFNQDLDWTGASVGIWPVAGA